ncbi:MAG: hypothetical protein Phyf2KO_09130 [Phycisphaerales bacterium]
MIVRLFILVLAFMSAQCALAQGVVTLKPVARLAMDAPITLADVAQLTGGAERFAGLVVESDPSTVSGVSRKLEVSLDDVQQLIGAASETGVGRLTIRGDTCRVILRMKQAPKPVETAEKPVVKPESNLGYTVRDHVEAKLVQTLGVPIDRLQIDFDEADLALLSESTQGWSVAVEPTGSSAKMPMRITMYDARGEIRDETIRVGVRILRTVVRTNRAIKRGTTLTADDFETDEAWLASDVPYVEPGSATNVRLKRSIGAGEMLTSGHVELAEVVQRGDIVSVHLISGTIRVLTEARALESGRVGDQIELASMQNSGQFAAVVKAPGRVVAFAGAMPLEGKNQ